MKKSHAYLQFYIQFNSKQMTKFIDSF